MDYCVRVFNERFGDTPNYSFQLSELRCRRYAGQYSLSLLQIRALRKDLRILLWSGFHWNEALPPLRRRNHGFTGDNG